MYFEYICWKFAGRLLDRVNTPLVGASARQVTAIRNVGLRAHETIKLNSIQNEPGE